MPGHVANSAPMCAQPRCQKKSGEKVPRMWAPAAWQTPHAGPAPARRAHYSTAYHSVIMYAGWAGGGRPARRQHGRSNMRIRPSQAAGTIVLRVSQASLGRPPRSQPARAPQPPCCVLHYNMSEVCACEAGGRRVRAGPAGAMLQVWAAACEATPRYLDASQQPAATPVFACAHWPHFFYTIVMVSFGGRGPRQRSCAHRLQARQVVAHG
jgi:hypothetical protein